MRLPEGFPYKPIAWAELLIALAFVVIIVACSVRLVFLFI